MKPKLLLIILLTLCEFGYSQIEKELIFAEKRNYGEEIKHFLVNTDGEIVGWSLHQNLEEVEDFTMRKIWIKSSQRFINIKGYSVISANSKSEIIATLGRGVSVSCGVGNDYKKLFIYNLLGKKIFESPEPIIDDFAPKILAVDQNSLYVTGREPESKNIILSKYNPTGDLLWNKMITSEKGSRVVDLFLSENENTIGLVVQIGYSRLRKLFILNENGEQEIEEKLSIRTNYCNEFRFIGNNQILTNDCWAEESFDPSIIELNIESGKISSAFSIPITKYLGSFFRTMECYATPEEGKFIVIDSMGDRALIFNLEKESEIVKLSEVRFSDDIRYLSYLLNFIDNEARLSTLENVHTFKLWR